MALPGPLCVPLYTFGHYLSALRADVVSVLTERPHGNFLIVAAWHAVWFEAILDKKTHPLQGVHVCMSCLPSMAQLADTEGGVC
jgi:hypothetical protein